MAPLWGDGPPHACAVEAPAADEVGRACCVHGMDARGPAGKAGRQADRQAGRQQKSNGTQASNLQNTAAAGRHARQCNAHKVHSSGQERLAGRVPARPLLPLSSRVASLAIAPGVSHARGKAVPARPGFPDSCSHAACEAPHSAGSVPLNALRSSCTCVCVCGGGARGGGRVGGWAIAVVIWVSPRHRRGTA